MRPKAAIELELGRMTAIDPKRTLEPTQYIPELTGIPGLSASDIDKGKTSQSW
jgi:hypothetical protein